MNLVFNTKVTETRPAVSESTIVMGANVDMAGFEGVFFLVRGSTLLGADSAVLAALMSAADSTATVVLADDTVTSTKLVAGADYLVMGLDVYRPAYRYVRARLNGTSSGNVTSMLAIQYGPKRPGSSALATASTTVANIGFSIGSSS